MKIRIFLTLLLTFTVGTLAYANIDFLSLKKAVLGETAPAFTLTDMEGNEHRLADYAGDIVMLHFWSTKCPFVVRYEERIKAIADQYREKGVTVIGIDSNSTEPVEEMIKVSKERGVNYLLLKDPGNKVADLYGAITTPHVYLVSPDRTLVYEGPIDNQGWAEENTPTQAYVQENIDALLEGKPVVTPQAKTFGCTVKREL